MSSIDVKQVNIWDYIEKNPEYIKEHGDDYSEEDYEFDEYSPDYDLGQFGQDYQYYYVGYQAYWDALVCYDPGEHEAVAVRSDVIDLKEATEYINNYLEETL